MFKGCNIDRGTQVFLGSVVKHSIYGKYSAIISALLTAGLFFSNLVLTASRTSATGIPWYTPSTIVLLKRSVTFKNGDATLRGTIYIPEVGHKVPAVVVFHGASEPLAGTPIYQHLREGFPAIGVAVLLFDRRGTGQSTGTSGLPYTTLADDGIAGARYIRSLSYIDAQRVGYWGISQGGWLAALAALRDPKAAFVIAVSAPLVTAEKQMEFAMSNQLAVLGYGHVETDEMIQAWRKLDGYFNGRNGRAEAVSALRKIESKPWFKLMYLPNAESLRATPDDSPWRGQMDVNFFSAIKRIKVPMLFLFGDSDPWIPVSKTVSLLQGASITEPQLRYAVVPHANHLMMTPPVHERMTDAKAAQVSVERPDSASYFMILTAWLLQTLKK